MVLSDWFQRLAHAVLELARPVLLGALELAQLKQAVAGVLLEMFYADFVVMSVERGNVRDHLQRHFDLASEELDKLVQNTEDQARCPPGWNANLALVNELMTAPQKRRLVACLCQLAQVDSVLHVMENAMLEQVAQSVSIGPREIRRIMRMWLPVLDESHKAYHSGTRSALVCVYCIHPDF